MYPAYFHTVLDVPAPPPGGLPVTWAHITACAPTGSVWSAKENRAADTRLRAHLRALALPHWRVTGRSISGDHAEPGWGVAMALPAAKAMGRTFLQKAIFWIQDGDLWVGECSPCGAFVRAGALSPKLNTPATPFAGREVLENACAGDAMRLAAVLRFLGRADERAAHAEAFIRDADDSAYTLGAWAETAAEFQVRLELAGRTSPFAKKLGYVCCCAESQLPVPAPLRPEFPTALATMWDTYGYEG